MEFDVYSRRPIRDAEVLARMELAFDLYEMAEQMMRQNLRHRNPEATEEEIEEGIRRLAGVIQKHIQK